MKRFCLFFTLISVLFLFVSCSDVSETGVVCVKFGEESSREIHGAWDENLKTEDCYWTYTAEKTQGNGAVGESTLNNASPKKWVERPVKTGVGLRGEAKEFSLGKWKFIVYGYKDAGYTQLVYTGMREVEFKTTSTAADKTVLFEVHGVSATSTETFTGDKASVASRTTYRDTGLLNIGAMSLTEPYGYDFMTGSTLLIELFKVAGTTETKIASSTTTVGTTSPDSVDTIALGAFSFVSGFERDKIADGVETIRVKVTYTPPTSEGIPARVIGNKDYFIPIGSGLDTLLAGTLNDIDWAPSVYVINLDLGDSAAAVAEISGDRKTTAVLYGAVRPFTVANGGLLDGYYTAATGGSKVIGADGTAVASVANWTDSHGRWIKESESTVYARYTYEVLNYITVGGGAYINTGKGIKPNSGAEIKYRVNAAETTAVLFGCRDGVSTALTDFAFWRPGNGAGTNKPNLHFGGTGVGVPDCSFGSVDIVTFKNSGSYFNAKLMKGDYPALGSSGATVFLGGLNLVNSGEAAYTDGLNFECAANNAHIYYYKQFEGEHTVLDLVPVKRLSDNVIGMLDTLTGTFLVNAGASGTNITGTSLTAGKTYR